jgi:hypothetical protein
MDRKFFFSPFFFFSFLSFSFCVLDFTLFFSFLPFLFSLHLTSPFPRFALLHPIRIISFFRSETIVDKTTFLFTFTKLS